MREGGEAGPPHPVHELVPGRGAGEVEPQWQGVDEAADQAFGLDRFAVGDRRPDDQILFAGEAGEQQVEGGEERHEEGRSGAACGAAQLLAQPRRQRQREACAARALHRRPRPVDGERHAARCAGQRLPPVGEMRGERGGVQMLALPACEVRVL